MGKTAKRAATKPTKKAASVIKHSNKKYSKLLKRKKANKPSVAKFNKGASGKFKQNLNSKRNKRKPQNFEDDALDQKKNRQEQKRNGKRKFVNNGEEPDEDEVNRFEKQPRRFEAYKNAKRVKALLPLKDRSGLIQQYANIEDRGDDEEVVDDDDNENKSEDVEANINVRSCVSTHKLSVHDREKRILTCKLRIATLATSILADPVSKVRSINDIASMINDFSSPIIFIQQKLALVSLLEIYKDIIPSYKIRSLSEQEKDQKMKSETRSLQDYEFSLLKGYREYLQRLEHIASVWIKNKSIEKICSQRNLRIDQVLKLGEVAVNCLCELLVTHPHFNFSHNILFSLVPFAGCKSEDISSKCCNALKMLYRQDKLGAISLEGVRQTAKILKEKSYNLNPKILNTFLSLKIKDIRLEDLIEEKVKKLTHKEKKQSMSKREFRKNKKMEKLENEMQETSAEESKKKKMTYQTEIIKHVFLIYFNVLKKSPGSTLLGAVLEGLAKFAHLINIEFFDDLISALHEILEKGILDVRQSLHCIATVFTILSGQGAALNIDPLRFYSQCYKNMPLLNIMSGEADIIPLLITCLDMMINKRKKQVSMARVFAFTHRTCTLALQSHHHSSVAILSIIRSFVQNFPKLDLLLDGETGQANGFSLPELDDPEHCNAGSTALWGIHLLKRHYHPTVSRMASHVSVCCPITGDGQLPLDLARKSPTELFEEYNPEEIAEFNPPLAKLADMKSTRRIKMQQKHWKPIFRDLHDDMVKVVDRIDLRNSFKNVDKVK